MVQEIIDHLPTSVHLYIDGTAGHGWHIRAIAESGKLADDATILAIDRDSSMLAKTQVYTQDCNYKILYIQDSYMSIKALLQAASEAGDSLEIKKNNTHKTNIDTMLINDNNQKFFLPNTAEKPNRKADFILLDLGVNMEHFKDGNRGFSIHEDAPLDMRFDTTTGRTAADILNTGTQEELTHAFITYGDFAPKSAQYFYDHIATRRQEKAFDTTKDLVEFLYSIGVRKHQLPIFFQCLRILTNQELEHLEHFLKDLPDLLTPWGRCAIITFHSIEDRIVKYAFKELEEIGECTHVNKKVIVPHYTETQKNRASRSAKLRIIEKKQ